MIVNVIIDGEEKEYVVPAINLYFEIWPEHREKWASN